MSKTIAQLKTTITSRLHGTTLNKLSDFYTLCKDTAEEVLSRIDPVETQRRALLTNAIYNKVYDYSLPSDFKAISDLNKQVNRYENSDNSSLTKKFGREFNNQKKDNQFTLVWENGTQYMRFSKYLNTPLVIDKQDSLTENGTLAVGGNASGLVLDTLNYVAGTGSAKADVSSSGAVQSVSLYIGENSSNYYLKTITTGHFESFKTGWNLLRFDLASASLTGTVDTASINYYKVLVTYNSGQTAYFEKTLTTAVDMSDNYFTDGAVFTYFFFDSITSLALIRLDNITGNVGTLYDISYYSNCLFRDTSGNWITIPTVDTDIINLSTESYKIFEAEMCRIITQQVQGAMGAFDFTYWDLKLEGNSQRDGLYEQYLLKYPTERIEGEVDYYNFSDDYENPNNINGEPLSYYN